MSELHKILLITQNLAWFFYLISMLVFYCIEKRDNCINSSFVTITITVAVGALNIAYEGLLLKLLKGIPSDNSAITFAWFMGFSTIEILGMVALYVIHKKENLRIERLGQFVAFAFFIRCMLQLIAYADIIINNSYQNTYAFYTYGMPAINISIALVGMLFATSALYNNYLINRGIRHITKWPI